ncbi:MAG: pyridoxal phosphate-dependent aminotransferase [Acidobacteria bacterium]|nr:pyridoxal phosphate-dependent aminotransferase [Acidobacteriota bacterium]
MGIKQTEAGMYEKGFDDDLSPEKLEEMLALFPTPEAVTDRLLGLRDEDGFTDMKRGELYPEVIGGGTRLRRTIARVYGVEPVQAQPNFSCNGCIDTFLAHVQRLELTDRRRGFLVATPTYFRYYHKVEALRMSLLGVPLGPGYEYPLEGLLAALRSGSPSCLFLVTPNNPTGLPIPDGQLLQILDSVPEELDVAIDRTCANIDPEISTREIIARYPHKRVAVFHSFSKYFGMSHLRIGFSLFSNRAHAAEVDRYVPFGLGLEALLRATYVLATGGELRPGETILAHIRQNRDMMRAFLNRRDDYSCSDFKSNYAVLTLPPRVSSREFHARMLERGVFVMPGHELPVPDERTVRIHTGGPPPFMERMIEAIEGWH